MRMSGSILLPLILLAGCAAPRAEHDARLDWWREARFGMFLHWGLYSIPAGEWNGRTDHAEWIRTTAEIPLARYEELRAQWNPVRFDADRWVEAASDAGMKYIVITSKHHDGFCLFDSRETDWDVMSTPFGRDVLKELAAACARRDIRLCFYHSIMDWHHPDYLPRREWETDRPTAGADFRRFVRYLRAQVTELLSNYGPIGVMWFDGEWEPTWNHADGQALYDLCRALQPGVIVNNRVDVGRSGMAGMTVEGDFAGDFGTPEQEVPATGFPGVDWESCMTLNDHWGYNAHDRNTKSTREVLTTLVDVASKGGNYLLNIGPTARGEFPAESLARLREVGRWMRVNGDAIHGTTASPIEAPAWGRVTTRVAGGETRLFLSVFDWPKSGVLTLTGLGNDPVRARILSDPARGVRVERVLDEFRIDAGMTRPDDVVPVVELTVAGTPIAFAAPRLAAESDVFVDAIEVRVESPAPDVVVRATTDGSVPTSIASLARTLTLHETTTVRARAFRDGRAVSPTSSRTFTRSTPWPALPARPTAPGLERREYAGDFERMPEFAGMKPVARSVVSTPSLAGRASTERVGLVFQGYLSIPADDVFAFELASDDGSRLWIDDRLAIDNDGLHASLSKHADLPLQRGLHALRVEWFNRTGGEDLSVRMARAGLKPVDLRAAELAHDP